VRCKCQLPKRRGGFTAFFWHGVKVHNRGLSRVTQGAAVVKRRAPSKKRFVWSINYRATGSYWKGLDSRYKDNFFAAFEGFIRVPRSGNYRFWTTSDDGSELYVHKRLVVDNDGLHGMATRGGSINLVRGAKTEIQVYVFERGGGAGMIVNWAGPGFGRRLLDGKSVWTRDDFPVKHKSRRRTLRRRYTARRRYKLSAKQLRKCGLTKGQELSFSFLQLPKNHPLDVHISAQVLSDLKNGAAAEEKPNVGEGKLSPRVERDVKIVHKAHERGAKEACAKVRVKEKKGKAVKAAAAAKELSRKRIEKQNKKIKAKEKQAKALRAEKTTKANRLASRRAKEKSAKKLAERTKKEQLAKEKNKKTKRIKELAQKKERSNKRKVAEAKSKASELKAKKVKILEKKKKKQKAINEAMSKRAKAKRMKERAAKKARIETVGYLPKNCRPTAHIRFLQATKRGGTVPVDIFPNGEVKIVDARFRYVSLGGILFPTKLPSGKTLGMSATLTNDSQERESRIQHVFGVQHSDRSRMTPRLGMSVEASTRRSGWSEAATKKAFQAVMQKHNNPDVWTLCAREGSVCRSRGKYKMKFGAKGKFRYRVSDGNTPCSTRVFGDPVKGKPKKCYKYTPNARRRRSKGIFANVDPTGFDARFYKGIKARNLNQAMRKSKTPGKRFFVNSIAYRSTGGHWPKLNSQYRDHFAAIFSGRLMIKKTGRYHFWLTSDDGSKLQIDGKTVVNNDGLHGMTTRHGSAIILRGTPKIKVSFFENGGGAGLYMRWSGPGFGRRLLSGRFVGKKKPVEGGNWVKVASEGKQFVMSSNSEIRFGFDQNWAIKKFKKGKVQCNTKTFGDPAVGKRKACFKLIAHPTKRTYWRPCAGQNQVCHGWDKEHKIRFGARGRFAYLTTAGNTPCNTRTFGNPFPGVKKQCAVLEQVKIKRKKKSFARRRAEITGLAYRRPTAQISTGWGGASSRAVDGNANGQYGAGSCTHTQRQNNPWWRVKLKNSGKGASQVVTQVKVFNRSDCCGNRLSKLEIWVGDKPYWSGNRVCGPKVDVTGKSKLIKCPKIPGKFVFVVLRQVQLLVLCEVQVFGLDVKAAAPHNGKHARSGSPFDPDYMVKLGKEWRRVGTAPWFSVAHQQDRNFCVLSGVVRSLKHLQGKFKTRKIGEIPEMCIPKMPHQFKLADGNEHYAVVQIGTDGQIHVVKSTKRTSKISFNGIYYFTSPPEGGKSTRKAVKNFPAFGVRKMGPLCVMSGCVAGEPDKTIGTVPKACRPKQRHLFKVAGSNPKLHVQVDTAGIAKLLYSAPDPTIGTYFPDKKKIAAEKKTKRAKKDAAVKAAKKAAKKASKMKGKGKSMPRKASKLKVKKSNKKSRDDDKKAEGTKKDSKEKRAQKRKIAKEAAKVAQRARVKAAFRQQKKEKDKKAEDKDKKGDAKDKQTDPVKANARRRKDGPKVAVSNVIQLDSALELLQSDVESATESWKGKDPPSNTVCLDGIVYNTAAVRTTFKRHKRGESAADLAKCSQSEYKVMKFSSPKATVKMANFLGMPSKHITVGVWIKGTRGTVLSYASKHNVKSFVITNPAALIVWIMQTKIETKVSVGQKNWEHLGVTWDSKTGVVEVYKNGKKVFNKSGIKQGKKITTGGCLMLGQLAKKECKGRIEKEAYTGYLTDLVVHKGALKAAAVRKMMRTPISAPTLADVNKQTGSRPNKDVRLAYLSRQWSNSEIATINTKEKKKKATIKKKAAAKLALTKALAAGTKGGTIKFHGSGDVHYSNFAGCKYDDQSVGEWQLLKVDKSFFANYPLTIQYRTSPQKTRCSWCQDGAVAYIDGCSVQYKGDQASAGFGGYNTGPYQAYAAMNGQQLTNKKWKQGTHMKVVAYTSGSKRYGFNGGNFKAILSDGSRVTCAKGNIDISVPKILAGKINGNGGTGKRGEWLTGPNVKDATKSGKKMPGLPGCPGRYQYHLPKSPYNGNHATKPIVKYFHSWQVDGKKIESIFYYTKTQGPGSFNRKAGQAVKGGMSKRPKGSRQKAEQKCRVVRNNPKAFAKCVFDVLVMGKKAAKETVRDRQAERMMKEKPPPKITTVRDVSEYRNYGEWVGSAHWSCATDFLKRQSIGEENKLGSGSPAEEDDYEDWLGGN